MEIIIIWALVSLFIGWCGANTTLGFGGSFLISLLLSPVIGIIAVLIAPYKKDDSVQQQILLNQQQQILNQQQQLTSLTPKSNQPSVIEELEKWKLQRESGIITEEEFQKIKTKLLATFD